MYDELVKSLRNMSKMGTKYGMAVVKMREAADAIEELISKLNNADNQIVALVEAAEFRRWIPVTERLPDFEGCLLCMRKAFVGDKLRYQDILYYEEGKFYMEFENAPIPTEVITHWMPLPEPPKEET